MTGSQEIQSLLRSTFSWLGDRVDEHRYGDLTAWWREPRILRQLGPALAGLLPEPTPTLVLGPETSGVLVGPMVAAELGIGFVRVEKDCRPECDSDAWLQRTSPPDYADRHLRMGFRKSLVRPGDRAVMVDDWVETGGQGLTVQALVADAGAEWLGVAALVDATQGSALRRRLGLRSLLHVREL